MKNVIFLTVSVLLLLLAASPFILLAFTGDFAGASHTYGIQEDSPIINFLLNIHSLFTK